MYLPRGKKFNMMKVRTYTNQRKFINFCTIGGHICEHKIASYLRLKNYPLLVSSIFWARIRPETFLKFMQLWFIWHFSVKSSTFFKHMKFRNQAPLCLAVLDFEAHMMRSLCLTFQDTGLPVWENLTPMWLRG